MSRYVVDKVCQRIAVHDDQRDRFLESPETYLGQFALTDDERGWLLNRDYGALYAMGGHPFLLWGWAQRVDPDKSTLLGRYTQAVAPHGQPDYST